MVKFSLALFGFIFVFGLYKFIGTHHLLKTMAKYRQALEERSQNETN